MTQRTDNALTEKVVNDVLTVYASRGDVVSTERVLGKYIQDGTFIPVITPPCSQFKCHATHRPTNPHPNPPPHQIPHPLPTTFSPSRQRTRCSTRIREWHSPPSHPIHLHHSPISGLSIQSRDIHRPHAHLHHPHNPPFLSRHLRLQSPRMGPLLPHALRRAPRPGRPSLCVDDSRVCVFTFSLGSRPRPPVQRAGTRADDAVPTYAYFVGDGPRRSRTRNGFMDGDDDGSSTRTLQGCV